LRRSPLRRTAFKRKRRKETRPPEQVSPDYLIWIRTLPCAGCGRQPTTEILNEAHHSGPRAASRIASDFAAIPLCHLCHDKGHYHLGMRAMSAALDFPALVDRLNHTWNNYIAVRRP